MFHPSEAGRDVDMQREGSRGQAKRSFLSDVVSFPSRIFSYSQKPWGDLTKYVYAWKKEKR